MEDMLRDGSVLCYGVLPYLRLLCVLCEKGCGHQGSSTGRNAVVLTCETKVQRLAAGRIIVRDEEERLVLSSFRFSPLGWPSRAWRKTADPLQVFR